MADNRTRLLRDINFFRSRISKINGAGDLGDYLYGIVVQKSATTAQVDDKSPGGQKIPQQSPNGTDSSTNASATGGTENP